MKVFLIGDFSLKADEGMSKLSKIIFEKLKEKIEVLAISTKDSIKLQTIRKVFRFNPEVIHYITGPTIRSFIILKIYSMLVRKAKIISSAIRPYFSSLDEKLIPFLKPDMILTQSSKWEIFFRSYGIKTRQLFNGVDCKKYNQVKSLYEKELLRQKHGITADKFVVLHVGHLKENRNLEAVIELQKIPDVQCVVIASTSTKANDYLKEELINAGCIVIHQYIENIEEIYQLSDCYVFCVSDKPNNELPDYYNEIGVIDTPLSVLEAMACNLPIITTSFGALPIMFKSNGGFYFYNGSNEDLSLKLDTARCMEFPTTRKMILNYDWEILIEKLLEIYSEVKK